MSFRPKEALAAPTATTPASRLDEVLRIGLTIVQAETGPKAPKEPKPPKEVVGPVALIPHPSDLMPLVQFEGEPVKTRNKTLNMFTQNTKAEKAWMRNLYGANWWAAEPALKKEMQQQAEHALQIEFAPRIIELIQKMRAELIAPFKEANYYPQPDGRAKLDFFNEVLPLLVAEHGVGWANENKEERTKTAKDTARTKKTPELEAELAVLQARIDAAVDETIEELQNPDGDGTKRARGLLRFWFNRPGKDKKMRDWSKVSKELKRRRLKWAKAQVLAGFDPDNPPKPPKELYDENDGDVYLSISLLVDPIATISTEGGEWLWKYMRQLEALKIDQGDGYAVKDAATWISYLESPAVRQQQRDDLKPIYESFVKALVDMKDDDTSAVMNYTEGSGPFQKYLLYKADDPSKIPSFGSGPGGVGGNNFSGVIGPPKKIHRLYKLLAKCPGLPRDCVFLRSTTTEFGLPHNLGKTVLTAPVVGRGYLNVTFISTTWGDPKIYYSSGPISGFHNESTACCMYALLCPQGLPVLPIATNSKASAYASEQEVLLPPGLVMVYVGEKVVEAGSKSPCVRFYQVEFPPLV